MNSRNKMKFRDFEFPVDPEIISINSGYSISGSNSVNGQLIIGNSSDKITVISGEGEFFGDDCMQTFSMLKNSMTESGMLIIPGRDPIYAWPENLEMICCDMENTLRYRFRFSADSEKPYDHHGRYIYGNGVCCLWDIAKKYSLNIDRLAELNRHIIRPDRPVGKDERICLW